MRTKLFAGLAALVLTLSGCAFSSGNEDENKAYRDAVNKLQDEFAGVVGNYQGFIQAASGNSIPLELSIFIKNNNGGSDAQGQPNVVPSLAIRYRQMDQVRPDEILVARYLKDTGYLSANNEKIVEIEVSLTGTLDGDAISGIITKDGGPVGSFKVFRLDNNASSPVDNTQDYIRRKLEVYKTLEGTYEGQVVAPPEHPEKKSFPVRIQMTVVPVIQNGKYIDVNLKGLYRRPDFVADPSAGERVLDISYSMDTNPPQMVMSSKGGTQNIPDAYMMNILGTIQNGQFQGDAFDRFGPLGRMTLKKKSAAR